MLLVLDLGTDGYGDLANVDPGHRALGLSKGTLNTFVEPRMRIAPAEMLVHWKGLSPRTLRATNTNNGLHTLLFATTAHQAPRGEHP